MVIVIFLVLHLTCMASRLSGLLLSAWFTEKSADFHALRVEGTMDLANVWLVLAEASHCGPSVPEKLSSCSSAVTSEEDYNAHLPVLTCWMRCITHVRRQLSNLLMLSCLMLVHFMNFHQPQLALWQCPDSYLYLYLSFYLSWDICLLPWIYCCGFSGTHDGSRVSASMCLWQWDLTLRS